MAGGPTPPPLPPAVESSSSAQQMIETGEAEEKHSPEGHHQSESELPENALAWLTSLAETADGTRPEEDAEMDRKPQKQLTPARIPNASLPDIQSLFQEHGITLDYLLHVEKEDWRADAKEMGIRKIGHRFALWRGMQKLRKQAAEYLDLDLLPSPRNGHPSIVYNPHPGHPRDAAGRGDTGGREGEGAENGAASPSSSDPAPADAATDSPAQGEQTEETLDSEMEEGAPDIMISLNVGTMKHVAINLFNYLTGLNYRVWVCLHMEAGDAFRIEIARSAAQCKAFIILLNEAWASSRECEYEFNVATRKNLTRGSPLILPVVMGGALFGLIGDKYPAVDAMLCNTNALVLERHDDPEERDRVWKDLVKTLGRRGVPKSLGKKDEEDTLALSSAAGSGGVRLESPGSALVSQQEQLEGLKLQFFLNAALGNVGMLEAMLDNPDNVKLGLHVNVVSERNDTALTFAARGPRMALVSMRKNPYKGMQDVALHWHQQMKADPNLLSRKQPDGSLRYDTPRTVSWLLARGADIHVVNHSGDNALSSACRGGQNSVIPILLANGARAVVNLRGMNLLSCALENNPRDMTTPCSQDAIEQLLVAFPQLRRSAQYLQQQASPPTFGRSLTGME